MVDEGNGKQVRVNKMSEITRKLQAMKEEENRKLSQGTVKVTKGSLEPSAGRPKRKLSSESRQKILRFQAVRERVIEVVAERTGYPPEMLDPDLDIEAGLGIDEEKKTQILTQLCGIYNLPVQNLPPHGDLPTLTSVIAFFAREETEKPTPADIGKIIAAAVKDKRTASVLDKPALNDINDIVAAAKEVFGTERGLRWLGTPVPALQYATPISLIETEAGRQKIHNALVSLVHGNW